MGNDKHIQVFAGQIWQASIIKNILEDNGIQAFLNNEFMGTIAPWQIEAGGLNTVKVMISNLDYELATKLIEEFNKTEPIE